MTSSQQLKHGRCGQDLVFEHSSYKNRADRPNGDGFMPQLIALALAGAAAFAGYKWIKKQNELVASRRKAAQPTDTPRNLGDLVWDKSVGVYRPRQDS